MLVSDLYKKYDIMPQLAEHQLRVGAVGAIVAENWKGEVDLELATKLCLLHDMGNIVKFSELTDPYWRRVQQEYRDRYGKDAHVATKGILAEAGLGHLNRYIDEESELYFAEAGGEELEVASPEAVILLYADFRVKPEGVVSYQERVEDLRERYGGGKSPTWYGWTQAFEKWLNNQVELDPAEIDEAAAKKRWDRLLEVEI